MTTKQNTRAAPDAGSKTQPVAVGPKLTEGAGAESFVGPCRPLLYLPVIERNIAMENGWKWSIYNPLWMIDLLKIVVFHGYLLYIYYSVYI